MLNSTSWEVCQLPRAACTSVTSQAANKYSTEVKYIVEQVIYHTKFIFLKGCPTKDLEKVFFQLIVVRPECNH